MSDPMAIDPVLLEVLRNRLEAIADEMELTLLKSAASPIVKEGLDASAALFNVHVGTRCVSTDDQAMSLGELQDELQADEPLSPATVLAPYSGLILCGGPGVAEFLDHPDVLRLTREADAQDKLLAAWGSSVAVLAKAGPKAVVEVGELSHVLSYYQVTIVNGIECAEEKTNFHK